MSYVFYFDCCLVLVHSSCRILLQFMVQCYIMFYVSWLPWLPQLFPSYLPYFNLDFNITDIQFYGSVYLIHISKS